METSGLARLLIGLGLVLLVAGVVVALASRLGLGRLPGDVTIGSGGLRVTVLLGTSLLVSVVATVVLNLFLRR